MKFKYDLSLPLSEWDNLVDYVDEIVRGRYGGQVISWGHLGDCNIHLNIVIDNDSVGNEDYSSDDVAMFIDPVVYDYVIEKGGSISAEHGIGVSKKKYVEISKGGVVFGLMKKIKIVFDPKNIMNPGSLF